MNQSVLLLDGDGTQTLPIAESLYRKGYILHSFYNKKISYGYPSKYIKYKEIASLSSLNEKEYLSFLEFYIKDKSIEVIIPMSDRTALFISKYKDVLNEITNFVSPDYQSFDLGYNKGKLMDMCLKHDFPHPRSIALVYETDITNIDHKIFPAILKPNYTTGGRGMSFVSDVNELSLILQSTLDKYGPCHLQEFIEPGGKQIKVQLFLDKSGLLIGSSVIHKQRYYPVNGGSSCCNVTINDNELVDICKRVLEKIGWVGFADFDLIEDPKDGVVKIMEINPRIPACIESALKSGIDYGELIVDESLGNNLKKYNYIPGKKLRHIGFEVLWFFSSKDRFKTKPNWFIFVDRNLSFQDFKFKDPKPFIYGTYGNLLQQFNPEFRKSKSALKK